MPHHVNLLATIAMAALLAMPANADLQSPSDAVLLTVTGEIAETNGTAEARFDLDMLRGLEVTTFSTTTPWTEGEQTFSGVSLATLLRTLGVSEGSLRATAINDYAIEIPVHDAVEGGPIIAFERNGTPMSVRDKGPLWIVYPYDSTQDYQSEVIYSRSIWQLDRIEILR